MDQASRGTKRRCPHCGAPFYDLNRDPPICPRCHEAFVQQARLPSTRRAAPAAPAPAEAGDRPGEDRFEEDEILIHDEDEDETGLGGEDMEPGEDEEREEQ